MNYACSESFILLVLVLVLVIIVSCVVRLIAPVSFSRVIALLISLVSCLSLIEQCLVPGVVLA